MARSPRVTAATNASGFIEPAWAPSIDVQHACARDKKPGVCLYFARIRWCRCVWATGITFTSEHDASWCKSKVRRPVGRSRHALLVARSQKDDAFGSDKAGWQLLCGPALKRGQRELPPVPIFAASRPLQPLPDGAGCSVSGAFVFFDLIMSITTPQREARVRRIGRELCLNVTIIPAYPKPATHDEWSRVASMGEPIQRLTAGEVAVRLSMRRANELFLSHPSAQSALIFEDDFSASGPQLQRRLGASLAALPTQWDMVFLGRCFGDCSGEHMGGDLYRTFESLCLHAYGVSRAGAAALLTALSNCSTKVCPADHAASNVAWERGRSFAIWPQIFGQSLGLRVNGSATLISAADASRGVPTDHGNQFRPPYLAECARKHATRVARSTIVPSWSSRTLRTQELLNDMFPLLMQGAELAQRWPANESAACPVSACAQAVAEGHPLWTDVTNLQASRAHLDTVDMQIEACALQTAALRRHRAASRDGLLGMDLRKPLQGRARTRAMMRSNGCMQRSRQGPEGYLQCPSRYQGSGQGSDAGRRWPLHSMLCSLLEAAFREARHEEAHKVSPPDSAPIPFGSARWPRPLLCRELQKAAQNTARTEHDALVPATLAASPSGWQMVDTTGKRTTLLPLPGAGSSFFAEFLDCWMPGVWQKKSYSTIGAGKTIAIVREPWRRFAASVIEMLRRGLRGECPKGRCSEHADGYVTDGVGTGTPWGTPRGLAQETSWYAPTVAALDRLAGPPNLKRVALAALHGFARDASCGRSHYGSTRLQSQHVLVSGVANAQVLSYEQIFVPSGFDVEPLVGALGIPDEDGKLRAGARQCHTAARRPQPFVVALPTPDDILEELHSDPTIQTLLCATYAADFACFGYDVPPACQHLLAHLQN